MKSRHSPVVVSLPEEEHDADDAEDNEQKSYDHSGDEARVRTTASRLVQL